MSKVRFKRFRADEDVAVVGMRQKCRWFPVRWCEKSKSGITLGRTAGVVDALRPDYASKHTVELVRLANLQSPNSIFGIKTHWRREL